MKPNNCTYLDSFKRVEKISLVLLIIFSFHVLIASFLPVRESTRAILMIISILGFGFTLGVFISMSSVVSILKDKK
jgi:hypothetical protein